MSIATDYYQFLDRVEGALASTGAQSLRSGVVSGEWQRAMLLNTPGSPTVYAFGRVSHEEAEQFQGAVNKLAAGFAQSASQSPTPLRLIAVAVFDEAVDARTAKRLAKVKPSAFYPGVRPSTVAVSLADRAIYSSRMLNSPEGFDALTSAVNGEAPLYAGEALHTVQRTSAERASAFYSLMQGRQPLVTYALIAVNVLVYILLTINGGSDNGATLLKFGAIQPSAIEHGEWWRLFAGIFLHASPAHILFNMTSLFAVGTLAERLYGSVRFLGIYLGAGLCGSLASFAFNVHAGTMDSISVGASGAIFGIAGALLTVSFQSSDIIPKRLRNQISRSMLPLVILSLVFANFTAPNIDNSAHVGGLVGGMLLSMVLSLTHRNPVSA